MQIEVVDVDTEDTIGSASAKGESGLATFGGDERQELIRFKKHSLLGQLLH